MLQPQLQMPQYAQLRGELNLPHAIRALENFIISVPPGRAEKEDQPTALVQFLFSAHDGITQKLQQATVGGNWSNEVDELVMLNSRISQVSVIGFPVCSPFRPCPSSCAPQLSSAVLSSAVCALPEDPVLAVPQVSE